MTALRSATSARGAISAIMGGLMLMPALFGVGGELSRSRPWLTGLIGLFLVAYGAFLFRLGQRTPKPDTSHPRN
jgi:hypothetical protein